MKNLKIIINGQIADFENDADFPLVFKRESIDFRQPSRRKAERSYKCKFPLTKNNERIFGPLKLLEQVSKFRTAKTYETAIYHGDLLIAEGVFRIDDVTWNEISGVIYANTGSVAVALEGSLRDLDAGEVDFDGWQSMIDNLEAFAASANGGNFRHTEELLTFPLISYANPFIPNKWSRGNYIDVTDHDSYSALFGTSVELPEGRDIAGQAEYFINPQSLAHFGFQDVPPAFYVVPILRAIFARAGYRLGGSWINDDNVRRLLVPFTNDRPVIYNWQRLCAGRHEDATQQSISIWQRWRSEGFNASTLEFSGRFEPNPGTPPFQEEYYTGAYNTGVYTGYGVDDLAQNFAAKWWVYTRELLAPDVTGDLALMNNTKQQAFPNQFKGQTRLFIPETAEYRFTFSYRIGNVRDWEHTTDNPNAGTPGYRLNVSNPGSGGAYTRGRFAVGLSIIDGSNAGRLDYGETLNDRTTALQNPNIIEFRPATRGDAGSSYTSVSDWIRIEKGKQVVPFASIGLPFEIADIIRSSNFQSPASIFGYPLATFGLSIPEIYLQLEIDEISIEVECRPAPDGVQFGDRLQVAPNLPDVPVKDFVQSLIKLFNLWLNVDEQAKTVSIENAQSFFLSSQAAYDITRKVGRKDFKITPPVLPREIDFKWNKDGDDFLTARLAPNYDYLFNSGIANATERAEIDSGIFASTEFRELILVENGVVGPGQTASDASFNEPVWRAVESINVPAIIGEDAFNELQNSFAEIEYDYQIRLLVADGFDRLGTGYYIRKRQEVSIPNFSTTEFKDIVERYDGVARLRFLDGNNQSARAFRSLAWNGEFGLFERLYGAQYAAVSRGYEAEASIRMTGYDYREMQINRPIVYNGNLYALKAIKNFSPLKDGLTSIILVSWFG